MNTVSTTSSSAPAISVPLRPLAITAVVTFALLMLTVTVVPGQSPILPLEIGVLMFALLAWVLVRRSRAAFVTMTVFAGLLLALAVKVLLGDALGDAGARQLVTDIPVLIAVGALFRFALLGARRATRAPRVA
jgi:hypothetical protein